MRLIYTGLSLVLTAILAGCPSTPVPSDGSTQDTARDTSNTDTGSVTLTGTWTASASQGGNAPTTLTVTFGGTSASAVSTTGIIPLPTAGENCATEVIANGTFTHVDGYLMLSYASGTRATINCTDTTNNSPRAPGASSDFELVNFSDTITVSNNMFSALIGSTRFTFTRQ